MILVSKPPLKPIKLTHNELVDFIYYLIDCNKYGFSGIHRYHAHKERERMYEFHLLEVFIKADSKCNMVTKRNATLKLNEIELHTLSVMFKRVDCTPFMLALQERFIKNLVKFN